MVLHQILFQPLLCYPLGVPLVLPPIWSQDYVCSNLTSMTTSLYPISKFLSYSKLSPSYQLFLASISIDKEPSTYQEAKLDPRWQSAMDLELQALKSNYTWEVVDLPPGKTLIGNKWGIQNKILFGWKC